MCVENVATSNGQWRANLEYSPLRQNNEVEIRENPIDKNSQKAFFTANIQKQETAQLGNRTKEPIHQSSLTSKKVTFQFVCDSIFLD